MLYKFSDKSKIDYRWICPGFLVKSTGYIFFFGKTQWLSQICLTYMYNGLRLSVRINSYWYAVLLLWQEHYEFKLSFFIRHTLTPNIRSCFLKRNIQFPKNQTSHDFDVYHLIPPPQNSGKSNVVYIQECRSNVMVSENDLERLFQLYPFRIKVNFTSQSRNFWKIPEIFDVL